MNGPIEIRTSQDHTYPIFLGVGDWGSLSADLHNRMPSSMAVAVVDANVYRLHESHIHRLLQGVYERVEWFIVPSGESSKSVEMLNSLLDFMLDRRVKRATPVIVAGGGVVGDLGGFAASVALRGLPFAQFPTTLLAMVDSSVGGKTGINHRTGKNLIGTFYQPEAVYIDLEFLKTLPRREWISGLGEVIKYAAIRKPSLFDSVSNLLANDANQDSPEWLPIIHTCVEIKAEIVRADEREQGIRSWLNFGHTFAHAMEAAAGYSGLLHGEAVYMGMVAATHLSNLLGASLEVQRLLHFNDYLQVKWPESCTDLEALTHMMGSDKKNTGFGLTFVTLTDWGSPRKVELHDTELVHRAWMAAIEDFR